VCADLEAQSTPVIGVLPDYVATDRAKAGQVPFMKMIALELGRHNIRCNAICPGFIDTYIQQRNTEQIGIEVELPQDSPAVDECTGC
jgi:NAD(P)-dependent dehydrogenase (short-subunit alcohol dehydrogenase family)